MLDWARGAAYLGPFMQEPSRMFAPGRRPRISYLALAAFWPVAFPAAAGGQGQIEPARDVLREWVQTEQLISEELEEWRTEKASIEDLLEVRARELALLDEELQAIREERTQAETTREELVEETESLESAAELVRGQLGFLEMQLLALTPRLPQPLREKLAPLILRLPRDPENTPLSLGQRMQHVVGILNEVDTFNAGVTLVTEIQEMPDGERAEVRVLYLGLGRAFFADRTGAYAGVLEPGKDGWEAAAMP